MLQLQIEEIKLQNKLNLFLEYISIVIAFGVNSRNQKFACPQQRMCASQCFVFSSPVQRNRNESSSFILRDWADKFMINSEFGN